MPDRGLWLEERPLVLASASAARFSLLVGAGIPVERRPAEIDERVIEQPLMAAGASPADVALALAAEKALAVSRSHPDRWVLGADQTLACEGKRFSKPASRDAAREQLRQLAGRSHALHAALAIARDGAIRWQHVETATLTMRPLREEMLASYLDAAGDKVLSSVGAYQLEGLGVHLMAEVRGEHSTVLGLPLIPFLAGGRALGVIAE
jgi:septum formation protein